MCSSVFASAGQASGDDDFHGDGEYYGVSESVMEELSEEASDRGEISSGKLSNDWIYLCITDDKHKKILQTLPEHVAERTCNCCFQIAGLGHIPSGAERMVASRSHVTDGSVTTANVCIPWYVVSTGVKQRCSSILLDYDASVWQKLLPQSRQGVSKPHSMQQKISL